MSLSLLIVEDEAIIADDLSMILEDIGYHIAGIASSFDEATQLLETESPDMVLLDIMLKGEKTGIDIAGLIQEKHDLPFVFITSLYDKSTVEKANKTRPSGYLVKPFKESDLQVTLQLAWKKHKESKAKGSENNTKKIFIRHNGAMVPLVPDEILYVEASDNYAIFYTAAKQFVVTQTLKSVEDQLSGDDFCRIHKTYLINLSKIDLIEHSVVFINGKALPIGKVYKKDLLENITVF